MNDHNEIRKCPDATPDAGFSSLRSRGRTPGSGRRQALTLLVIGLTLANGHLAVAHWWWYWHWDKSTIGVAIWNYAADAGAARVDWNNNTDLTLPLSGVHTDISAFGGNYGNNGWWGLASIESAGIDWPWHCGALFFAPACRIVHGHARYNSFYGGSAADRQGVFCQEIGHLFGLDHSNTGDCMGKGYYNAINVTGPHNWADINARY